MKTLHELVRRLARQERQNRKLLAPVVAPGRAVVRLEGLVHKLRIEPADFSGFGLFVLTGEGRARLERSATPAERDAYCKLWPVQRLRLLAEVGTGWLAWGPQGLATVQLVPRGAALHSVQAVYDGAHYWYRRCYGERLSEGLAQALSERVDPECLRIKSLTPLDRAAYRFVFGLRFGEAVPTVLRVASGPGDDGQRLRQALARGGGRLRSFTQNDDQLQVDWVDSQGVSHFSRLWKRDLTVISSGICLSGRDQDFDLTSLVGVVEGADHWD